MRRDGVRNRIAGQQETSGMANLLIDMNAVTFKPWTVGASLQEMRHLQGDS